MDLPIISNPEICSKYALNGKAPKTVTKLTIHEVFMHCGKAPLRGGIWKPETWPIKRPVPNLYEIVKAQVQDCEVPNLTQDEIQRTYDKTLY